MFNKAKAKHLAKKLVALSFEKDRIDTNRVEAVLRAVAQFPFSRRRPVLVHYMAGIRQELKKEEATLEYAGEISQAIVHRIEATMSEHYKTKVHLNPIEDTDLIAGFRIKIGDDVWESSLNRYLNNLAESAS